jgi:osmotically-inducible protein OsmY
MNRIPKLVLLTALALSFAFVTGCASTAKQESTGEYFDDSVVTTKVKAAILNDPDLKVLQINVETFKGVVQLSGFVDSKAMMAHAVDVTRGVAGVKSVKDNMRVR